MATITKRSISNLILIYSIVCIGFVDFAQADFFKTTTRRNLLPQEYGSVVKIQRADGRHCSGFRVKTNQDRLYIATARHCLDYHATDACETLNFEVVGAPGGLPFRGLTCSRLVAASLEDDMMIFEAFVDDSIRTDIFKYLEAYSLADYYPAIYAGLQMVGFPADKYQHGKPTMSETCNVQHPRSLQIDGQDHPHGLDARIKPELGKHNCDVYGGNSGGPIRIRNTRDAVAMPASYQPNYYKRGNLKAAALMELTKGFIDRNRQSLIEAGISLSREPVRNGGTYLYLKSIKTLRDFANSNDSSYRVRIVKTDLALGTIDVSFSQDGGQTFNPSVKFLCEDDQSYIRVCYHQGDNQDRSSMTWYLDSFSSNQMRLVAIKEDTREQATLLSVAK